MESVLDNVKEETISLDNFPFICRICLRPGDLRPFKDEYLLNTFQNITKIDVLSTSNYPRNICEVCVNKLKEISLFIDIWKFDAKRERKFILKEEEAYENGSSHESGATSKDLTEECKQDISLNEDRNCRLCLSPSGLMSIEGKGQLFQLFQNITNIDVEDEIDSVDRNSICKTCIGKLEDISSFISWSLAGDKTLESVVVCENELVKTNSLFDSIDTDPSACTISDETGLTNQIPLYFIFACEIKQESDTFHPSDNDIDNTCSTIEQKPGTINVRNDIFTWTSSTEGKPHKCDHCKKSFSQKSNLPKHLPHTREKPLKCDICDKSFARSDYLRIHLLTHTKEKPHKCDLCKKSFSQRSNLRRHSLTHTGEKSYKSNLCDKSFALDVSLKSHLLTHTKKKPYECDHCQKRFPRKSNLRRHSLTHTGEKSFKCNLCDRSFALTAGLKSHLLTHTGEKPHKCDHCQKRFSRKDSLRNHLLTHTRGKPFKCDFCTRRFVHAASLGSHLLTHTKEKPYECNHSENGE